MLRSFAFSAAADPSSTAGFDGVRLLRLEGCSYQAADEVSISGSDGGRYIGDCESFRPSHPGV